MKRVILSVFVVAISVPTFAADGLVLPPAYAGPQYATPDNYGDHNPWSRPYVGIFGGVAAGDFNYATNLGGVTSELTLAGGGLEGGLRVGYDYANSNFLVGAVADYALTTIRARGDLSVGGVGGNLEARVSSIGTIRGRLGVTQKNNLYYVHGGAAFGTMDITDSGNAIPGVINNPRLGFTLGAGYEYAISQHASFQTEYSYTDLGSFDVYTMGPIKVSERVAFHKIASGFNIRF